jgi:nitroreductase
MDLAAVDHVLTTTRSVRRRLDLDRPVDPKVIEECLEIAVQAPTGGNIARYHFVVVTDPAKKAVIGDHYRRVFFEEYLPRRPGMKADFPEREGEFSASAAYLAEHFHEVPLMVIPCVEARPEDKGPLAQAGAYGNILGATWSFMLALRARGLVSAWTTLHIRHEREIGALLGIPETMTQAALLPVGHPTGGEFHPARRVPARERTYWDAWGRARQEAR